MRAEQLEPSAKPWIPESGHYPVLSSHFPMSNESTTSGVFMQMVESRGSTYRRVISVAPVGWLALNHGGTVKSEDSVPRRDAFLSPS